MSIKRHKKQPRDTPAGAATADGADLGRGGRVTVRAAAIGHSGLAAHNSDSDTPESAGASADERSGGAGGVHNSADELGDSAESAGLSGDDEAHDDRLMQAGPRRGQSGAGAPAGQVSAGRKRKRPVTAAGELDDDDETAFSDGEEAPLMSPEGVAAATAGLEEPSSEDDDDDDDEQEGGGGGAGRLGAWGGRLAEAGDSDDSDAEDDDADRQRADAAAAEDAGAFKNSAKGAAVARAFARIMEKTRPDDRGTSILSKSKSVAKRKREEKAERTVDMEARHLRQEMKRRGHIAVPKHGEGPEQDIREKALLKVARRGVVRLFNAVSRAQKQQLEESVVGKRTKGTTLSKAKFLAELQGATGTAGGSVPNPGSGVGGKLAVPIGGFAAGISAVSAAATAAAQDTAPPAWDVLQDDYTGLQAGGKMKDWDKREDSDDAPAQEVFDDPVQSDSEGDAW